MDHPTDVTAATAEGKARLLLQESGVRIAPVPVEEIAMRLGAQIVHQRLDPTISGLLLRENGAVLIAVNDQHHPHRRRFTIAHEIGHLQMHKGEYIVDSTVRINRRDSLSSTASDKEEIEANAFAAQLLMPRSLILESLERLHTAQIRNHARVISSLAGTFGVSNEAIGYRLINLGLST